MVALVKTMRQRGADFRMVAVAYDDDWAAQEAFLKGLFGAVPDTVTLLRDPAGKDGETAGMMKTRFGTEKIPESYVLKDGVIVAKFVNSRDWVAPAIVDYFEALSAR
jgi:hypothetical protein